MGEGQGQDDYNPGPRGHLRVSEQYGGSKRKIRDKEYVYSHFHNIACFSGKKLKVTKKRAR